MHQFQVGGEKVQPRNEIQVLEQTMEELWRTEKAESQGETVCQEVQAYLAIVECKAMRRVVLEKGTVGWA